VGPRWSQKEPLDLRFLPAASGGGARLDRPAVAPGLCVGRLSGSTLDGDHPGLVARTMVEGADQELRCDTVLVDRSPGGSVFVAGTDRWCAALEGSDPDSACSPPVASLTARILGVVPEVENTGLLVSIVMTAHDDAQHIARAV